MPSCRICQNAFQSLKFETEHISICVRCVNTLNGSPEPATYAAARLAEKLKRGMFRNAEIDLQSIEEWKRRKAQQTLQDLDAAVAAALHDWITRLLAKPENSARDFKMMRAHRRGLLRLEGYATYPSDWKDVATRIRRRDKKCAACGREGIGLDVHHIVYLSKHGTNQQSNLVGLCRPCHEAEHGRDFDWPEAADPEPLSPIQPPLGLQRPPICPPPPPPPPPAPAPAIRAPSPPSVPLGSVAPKKLVDLQCPSCTSNLTLASEHAKVGQQVRCKQCGVIFRHGVAPSRTEQLGQASAAAISTPSIAPPTVQSEASGAKSPPPRRSSAQRPPIKAPSELLIAASLLMAVGLILIALLI